MSDTNNQATQVVDNLLLEARSLDVAELGHFADTYDGVVDSPCVNVCRMDADNHMCVGCFRTLDEIAQWSRASEDAKRAILAAVEGRRAENDRSVTLDGDLRGDGNR